MVDIHHVGTCDAPVSTAFAYLDDYRNATSWMFGLSRFEPADGHRDQGLGSVFHGTFSVKPVKLSSTIEITEWEQDEVISFESVKGFRNWSTWRFHDGGRVGGGWMHSRSRGRRRQRCRCCVGRVRCGWRDRLCLLGNERMAARRGDVECPRSRGHLIAWVCPTRRKGCGVHATHASPVSGAVPS